MGVAVVIAVIFFVVVMTGLVIKSHFEAKAYNRLTGANVTWQDAFWVQLRVDATAVSRREL